MHGVREHQDFVLRATMKLCLLHSIQAVYTIEKQEFLKLGFSI